MKQVIERARYFGNLLVWVLCAAILSLATGDSSGRNSNRPASDANPIAARKAIKSFGNLPISFEINQGQAGAEAKFLSRGAGRLLLLTENDSILMLQKKEKDAKSGAQSRSAMIRMRLLGANPKPAIAGNDPLPGKSNYLIGNDPSKWHRNVDQFARVRYQSIYPKTDLVFYGNGRELEFDFEMAPGADPSRIRLGYEGADRISIDSQGDLILHLDSGEVRQHKPRVYQSAGLVQKDVEASYALMSKGEIGFRLGKYDPSLPLTIDPVLNYATYLGGSSDDYGYGIAVDASGNAYVAGHTYSANFPTTTGAYQIANFNNGDVFITKLNNAGSLIYSTYLGGSDTDNGYGIAVNSSGNAFITGGTYSTNFPTTAGAFRTIRAGFCDAFVAMLNPAGSALVYSTYLGGGDNENGRAIAADTSGNAYVTGETFSTNFPTVYPIQASKGADYSDAFVTKLNPSGIVLYSTYMGGVASDFGNGIAADSLGNAYVTGSTHSSNFPVTTIAYKNAYIGGGDAFVAKLNASGSAYVFSTYLGGHNFDSANAITLDGSGNSYVTGQTLSTDFPTSPGAVQTSNAGNYDTFLAKLNLAGSALVFSSYLGGSYDDTGYGVAVDSSGNAWVVGQTNSPNFPVADAIQPVLGNTYGVYKTTNSASNWSNASAGLPPFTVSQLVVDYANSNIAYAFLNGQGIYKTTNGGSGWNLHGTGLPSPIQSLVAHPSNSAVLYAAAPCAGISKSSDSGLTWNYRNNGLSKICTTTVSIDPSNPNTVYAVDRSNYIYKSANGADTWGAGVLVASDLSWDSIHALAVDPTNSNIVYVGGNYFIYKSTDGGSSWNSASTGLPASCNIRSLAIDPVTPATVYASAYSGLYKSINSGASWSTVFSGSAYKVVLDPVNTSTLYALGYQQIYKTTNGFSSWTSANSGIPVSGGNLSALAIAPSAPATLYMGLSSSSDGFITKFNSSGMALPYSSYFGSIMGVDVCNAVTVDSSGRPYITGTVYQNVFQSSGGVAQPFSGGNKDAFVVRIEEPPLLNIQMSKQIYLNGDTIAATEFRLKYLGSVPLPVELKVWLRVPGLAPISIYNLGADGSFVYPPGINANFGPLTLFAISSAFPRGGYEFSSRLFNPSTLQVLSESINLFQVQ